MRHDLYHHSDPVEVERSRRMCNYLNALLERLDRVMSLLDDLQAKADATLQQVQNNSDLDNSIIALVTANAQQIKDLKAALDAAGTDPVKLKALSDTMDKIAAATAADTQKTADAITANTPAA